MLFSIFTLGFASGLPFLLTLSTLSFWLLESGNNKATLGLFIFTSLPYSIKFLWAPFFDCYDSFLGGRKGWMIISQIGLVLCLIGISFCNPVNDLSILFILAFAASFCAASQDILIDAYRIELLPQCKRNIGAAIETVGFQLGMIASGAGTLYLADFIGWQNAYRIVAIGVMCCMIAVLHLPQEPIFHNRTYSWKEVFGNFWQHNFRKNGLYVLFLILCLKFADASINTMTVPFLSELGVNKIEFANISKIFGLMMMITGSFSAGIIMHYLGTFNGILLAILMQLLSCMMFALLAVIGKQNGFLWLSVGVENFCSGLTAASLIAYLSSICKKPHTATHFSLWYSFGSLCRVFISGLCGITADFISWTNLFLGIAFLLFPMLLFVLYKRTVLASFESV